MSEALKGNVKPGSVKVIMKKDPSIIESHRKSSKKTPNFKMFITNWTANEKNPQFVPKQFENSFSPVR